MLLSLFSPVLAANISVPYCGRAFASDASLSKGAYTVAPVSPAVASSLWLAADNKGFYTRLDEPWRAALSAAGLEPSAPPTFQPPEPQRFERELEKGAEPQKPALQRKPLGQRYDFLLAGQAPLSLHAGLTGLGLVGAPVLDASASRHLDLKDPDALEWAMHLLMAGKLASLALFPPCGALSVLRRGQRKQPRRTPRALRAASSLCALFWCAWRCCVPVLFVVSGTSALCSSPRLTFLEGLPGVTASRLPACSRGVCHSGSLLVLSSGFENLPWDTPSTSVCLPVKGREEAERRPGHCFGFTSQVSACLATHLLSRPSTEEKKSGLESLVVNDLLCARPWKAGPAWSWDRPEHINVLEARAYLKVLRDLAAEGGDLRYTHVVDSSVTLGAAAKGRSSTRALRGLLLRNAALQIAGGLYPTVAFGPTRLNVADDPTRNVRLRAPCKHSLLELLKPQDLYLACSFKQLRRPTANWLRLACLLVGFKSPRPLVGFLRALGAPWRKERTESLLAGSPAQRPDPPLPSTGRRHTWLPG